MIAYRPVRSGAGPRLALILLTAVTMTACGSDSPTQPTNGNPTMSEVAGTYNATLMVVTQGGADTDLMAPGGNMQMTLNSNGSVTGVLTIPQDNPPPQQISLNGTWTLNGSTVQLSQPQGSIGGMPFTFTRPNRLVGDRTENNIRIRVTLQK